MKGREGPGSGARVWAAGSILKMRGPTDSLSRNDPRQSLQSYRQGEEHCANYAGPKKMTEPVRHRVEERKGPEGESSESRRRRGSGNAPSEGRASESQASRKEQKKKKKGGNVRLWEKKRMLRIEKKEEYINLVQRAATEGALNVAPSRSKQGKLRQKQLTPRRIWKDKKEALVYRRPMAARLVMRGKNGTWTRGGAHVKEDLGARARRWQNSQALPTT